MVILHLEKEAMAFGRTRHRVRHRSFGEFTSYDGIRLLPTRPMLFWSRTADPHAVGPRWTPHS